MPEGIICYTFTFTYIALVICLYYVSKYKCLHNRHVIYGALVCNVWVGLIIIDNTGSKRVNENII